MPDRQDSVNAVYENLLAALGDLPSGALTEVLDELLDDKFESMRHGARHTRNRGCTGPLCKKALRDWQAERTRTVNALAGRTTRRHARSSVYEALDPLLAAVKAAHDVEFELRRAGNCELQLTRVA